MVLRELFVSLKMIVFFSLFGFAIEGFLSGLNLTELHWKISQPVLQLSLNYLMHFCSILLLRNILFWVNVLSTENSESFLSNKGEIWMTPLYNFNMFSMSDKSHAYVYATWKIVNQISLTLKIYFRYYFKLMSLFFSCHWQLFREGKFFQKRKGLWSSKFQNLVTLGTWLLKKDE